MSCYIVTRKADGAEVARYTAAQVVEFDGFTLDLYDHTEFVDVENPVVLKDADWYINVGPFYDRFGAYKIPILASTDPVVQAIIKDSSVRKYIDLKGRRAELLQAIQILQSKGFAVSTSAVLDVPPTPSEAFNG